MEQKNKIFNNIVLIMILLGLSLYSLQTYFYNVELNKIITNKDKILGDLLLKDSIHNLSEKKYSENIQKYVEECSFIVDGKTISSQELVNIVQKLYNERDNLNYEKAIKSDSLKQYIHLQKFDEKLKDDCLKIVRRRTDSLQLYMAMFEVIEKKYKTGVRARIEGSNMVFSTPINKIDSALAVYKYYKHKLKVDKNAFTVEIDSDNPYSEKTEKKSEKQK
jgi:hypothetical protein